MKSGWKFREQLENTVSGIVMWNPNPFIMIKFKSWNSIFGPYKEGINFFYLS